MTSRIFARRALYVIAWTAALWAGAAARTGGVSWMIGPIRVSSRQPLRIALVAIAAAGYYAWRFTRAEHDADASVFETWLRRVSIGIPVLAVLFATVVGFHYGSFAAGGSDSYGYVSQADLWLRGKLRIEQPWVDEMSWPNRGFTFAPLGYRPLAPESGTIVPTYSPGLPLLMAGFKFVFGANGPFFVVPILGILGVWFTYLLGREAAGSRSVGIGATALVAASPIFIAQLMLPMTDVPVAVGWTLVCLLAIKQPTPYPFLAGLVAAATLLIRPNLLLLALAPLAAWASPILRGQLRWPAALRNTIRYAIGLAPAVIGIAIFNTTLYGSPLVSGYGNLLDTYALSAGPENLRNYSTWLVQAHTPLVVFAVVPLLAKRALRDEHQGAASARACLASIVLLTVVSYIFYSPFTYWTYLRFFLPALPALFVLMAAGVRWVCLRLPKPMRAPAGALLLLTAVVFDLKFAQDRYVFNQRPFEQRYVRAAYYVDRLTPSNAMILSMEHSGSIRYYAHRITLRYDWLDKQKLDATLRELKEKGYRPFIVVDDWEETDFRKQFAEASRVGRLDWKPLVRVLTNPEVRIYDPEGWTGQAPQ